MTTFEKFAELIGRAEVMRVDSTFLLTSWIWNPGDKVVVPLAFGYTDADGNYTEESFLRSDIEDAEFIPSDGRFVIENTNGEKTQITFHKLKDLK